MARVDLFSNDLTLFEEGVFKEMLQQIMSAQPRQGYLWVAISRLIKTLMTILIKIAYTYYMNYIDPFICGCDLAWLVRDNRDLFAAIPEAKCASDSQFPSMRFENLDPEEFAYCFQTTTFDPATFYFTTTIDPTTSDSTISQPNTANSTMYSPSTFYYSSTPFDRTTSPATSDVSSTTLHLTTTLDPTQSTSASTKGQGTTTSNEITTMKPDANTSPTNRNNTNQICFIIFVVLQIFPISLL